MLNTATLRDSRIERSKCCLKRYIVISNKALWGDFKVLEKLIHSFNMPCVVLVIFATHEAKANIVYCVMTGDFYEVEKWHIEFVALVRCINLYTVGVLLDDLEAIRVCKKEVLHAIIAVVLQAHEVLKLLAILFGDLKVIKKSEQSFNWSLACKVEPAELCNLILNVVKAELCVVTALCKQCIKHL